MVDRPANALSPRAMLASGIHAQPGAYALLLGSGISRPAGILTGWQIAIDLVRRVAVAHDPEDTASQALAVDDPERWWYRHGQGDFGYSDILATLAPSAATRQGHLAPYFQPSQGDLEEGLKQPTGAHKAIADLAKEGWVKVILTTNFDRLTEDALTAANVPHRVIDRPEQSSDGAVSIARGLVTVIKVNGDWTDLEFRNTVEELDEYPDSLVELLRRIFGEYGLLICAWSAEWDKALVRVLESTPRRYPLYWDSRSSGKEEAQRILNRLGGFAIQAGDADQLFRELASSVDALQKLAEPPLETKMAIERLKRALPDPIRRIELQDLIHDKATEVTASLSVLFADNASKVNVDSLLDSMLEVTKPMLALLVNGVRYDDGTHRQLWVGSLQRLIDVRRTTGNLPAYDDLRHYPALLALRAMSIEALRLGRDDAMIELLIRPRWRFQGRFLGQPISAAGALHMNHILDENMVNALPRWNGQRWQYPASYLLSAALKDFFEDEGVDAALYQTLCDDVEYRTGLVQYNLPPEQSLMGGANMGTFAHPRNWHPGGQLTPDDQWAEVPDSERRFRDEYAQDTAAAWDDLLGAEHVDEALAEYRAFVRKYMRYR